MDHSFKILNLFHILGTYIARILQTTESSVSLCLVVSASRWVHREYQGLSNFCCQLTIITKEGKDVQNKKVDKEIHIITFHDHAKLCKSKGQPYAFIFIWSYFTWSFANNNTTRTMWDCWRFKGSSDEKRLDHSTASEKIILCVYDFICENTILAMKLQFSFYRWQAYNSRILKSKIL